MEVAQRSTPPALEMQSITKRFPGVLANNNINFQLVAGEIHALLGENGAGKSTLMNILYGLYQPTSGRILLQGKPVRIESPRNAIAHGIGMVHQHFMLVPTLTVTENIVLGQEEVSGFLLNRQRPAERIRQISQQYGLAVDPHALVQDLSVGAQQRVEIVKALYRNAQILVLDEPTAVLTPLEVEDFFKILRSLTQQGKSIIFITHKLKEVLAVADRITVLRQGQVAGTTTPAQTSEAELAAMMVGRSVLLRVEKPDVEPGVAVLQVNNLTVESDRHTVAVDDVSFEVRAGEVLGIAGVEGNGQSELVEAITGLRTIKQGHLRIGAQEFTHASPKAIIEAGTAHIPEDRHKYGLVLSYTISSNIILSTYDRPPFTRGLSLDEEAINTHARQLMQEYDVRAPDEHTIIGTLSGGNQQKVIIAREFSRPTRLLVAAQPTRGLDVGSIEFIHRRILEQRSAGAAVLLISAELDEILSLSDRILVMYKGTIAGERVAAETNREDLGLLMTGTHASVERVADVAP